MTEFEKRGVTLKLLQSVRDHALRVDLSDSWTVGKVSAFIVGNHEILKENCRWGRVDVEATLTFRSRGSLINLLKKDYPTRDRPHPLLGVSYEVGALINMS